MVVKKIIPLVSITASLLAVVLLVWFFLHPMSAAKQITQVQIGATTIAVEVADTEGLREQGLSGRASLAEGSGMLFVFDMPQTPGFWMKDMNFSLDMLFVDASGKIVTIDQNLSPATYNAQNPQASQVFRPSSPVRYVLEVPAGFAAQRGIAVGQVMQLQ